MKSGRGLRSGHAAATLASAQCYDHENLAFLIQLSAFGISDSSSRSSFKTRLVDLGFDSYP